MTINTGRRQITHTWLLSVAICKNLPTSPQQVYLDMQPYHEWYQEKHKGEVAEDSGGAGGRCHVVSRFSKSR